MKFTNVSIILTCALTFLLTPALRAEPVREDLAHAYRLLKTADADYAGHRVAAMEALQKAGHELNFPLEGDAPSVERQWKSDDQLREAHRLLLDAREKLEARDRERIAEHVNHAIQEVELALKAVQPIAAPREEIAHAYRLIKNADADYAGHRLAALESLKKAGHELNLNLEGETPSVERQWKSDLQLREAHRLLLEAKGKLEARDRERVAEHVDHAIHELDAALKVR